MKNLIHFVFILVAVPLSTTGAEEVTYAQVGETVTLRILGISRQKTYVYWMFGSPDGLQLAWVNPYGGSKSTDDKSWKEKLSLSGDSLVISSVQEEHFGTFFCKQTLSSQTVSITPYKLIKVSVSMNPASPLLLWDSLSLACNVGTAPSQKKPDIHWLSPQGKEAGTNQGMHTSRATSQDHGQWTCVVKNNNNEYKATIFVAVVDLSSAAPRQYTSAMSPLNIPCSIPPHITWKHIKEKGVQEVEWHFLPEPSSPISGDRQRLFSLSLADPLTWEKDQDRGLIPVGNLTKGNLSLSRYRGKEDDRGSYTCSMTFKNGVTLNRTVHVEVLHMTSSPGTELIFGQQVNLSCSIGKPLPPDVQLKLFPPDKSSLLKSDHHPAIVTIPEVGSRDSGKWRCELWQGNVRLTSAVIILKTEPRLSVWMLVIICSAAVIIILLLVLAFILCHRRQRKMRHLRHRLCQCKNPKPKGFYRT